jgi:hypothetical protein
MVTIKVIDTFYVYRSVTGIAQILASLLYNSLILYEYVTFIPYLRLSSLDRHPRDNTVR